MTAQHPPTNGTHEVDVDTAALLTALQGMDPYQFEHLVADVWEALGWETEVSSASNDRGVDVTAVQHGVFTTKTLIQVKRYGPDTSVGSEAVQQYASLRNHDDDVDLVVIVTTSGFTHQAVDMADRLNVKLIGGSTLVNFIEDLPADVRQEILEDYLPELVREPVIERESVEAVEAVEPVAVARGVSRAAVPWIRYMTGAWVATIVFAVLSVPIPPLAAVASVLMLVAWPLLPIAMTYDAHSEERQDTVLYGLALAALFPVVAPLFGVAYLARIGEPLVPTRDSEEVSR